MKNVAWMIWQRIIENVLKTNLFNQLDNNEVV
jgi:hypothetical protein